MSLQAVVEYGQGGSSSYGDGEIEGGKALQSGQALLKEVL